MAADLTNSSFSEKLPTLQLAVDSTSLGEAKCCPRKYYYSIVEGWEPKNQSVHLTFGLLVHRARELYDRRRIGGDSHDQALDFVIDDALKATWNKELNRPWLSGDSNKNRVSLLRVIVWYLDQFQNDPLETIRLANGKPAVELSFSFDTGLKSSTGEAFLLCGHLDRLARLNGQTYVVDVKTTAHGLDHRYFSQFTPDNQFSLYTLASKVVFSEPTEGLILDAIQVGVNFIRCQRQLVPRPKEIIDEWWDGLSYWLTLMNQWAFEAKWPLNDKACNMYGGCPFKPVCSRPPKARQQWLELEYQRRVWDPLQRRGDV